MERKSIPTQKLSPKNYIYGGLGTISVKNQQNTFSFKVVEKCLQGCARSDKQFNMSDGGCFKFLTEATGKIE